jgi:tRNA-specific 2-thiouridylase
MALNKQRVLVGMSGGVDSSVAAALLKDQGFEVIGITITSVKIDDNCKPDTRETGCCNYQAIMDAMDVCTKLGIEHHLIDLSEIFKEKIISNFIDEYMSGRTPNPCTLCNPLIKWGEVLKKADEFECFYYATGHYANISHDTESNRYYIKAGDDEMKDQSYFLWGLSQSQLSRTLFPLANLVKTETRAIAERYAIPVYNKVDSQEICFVPSDDYKDFLIKNVVNIESNYNHGDILFRGVVIGKHRGYPFYTIGQRKGLGVSHSQPIYVKDIVPETNTIVVDIEEAILSRKFIAKNINLMKYSTFPEEKLFDVKIRYRDKGNKATCRMNENNELEIEFLEPRKAITPGQSVVVYEGADLVCGAVIESVVSQ